MAQAQLSTTAIGKIILVTGAARSGKSEWAEYLASQSKKSIVYLATASSNDEDREWQERIRLHQQRRPSNWRTVAEPRNIAKEIASGTREQCFLIDSLGSWVANLLALEENPWQTAKANLLQSTSQSKAQLIFVAEETGWGVVPAYPSGRLFRDRLGNLIRCIGEIADNNYLVTGGYAIDLCTHGISLQNMKQ